MLAIKHHFSEVGREPRDIELETIAQTWSEHCYHKTFKSEIDYEEYDESGKLLRKEKIKSLFKDFIRRATEELKKEGIDWLFSVFDDNAGIVDFFADYAIAFKVETHNHPSAIEPFGGAATGVGGVIRDILGVWGEPIACTDVLCFGDFNASYESMPREIRHPKFAFVNIISGIKHYGNNIGVPTVNGAILFDRSYTANPLVYCGCVGIVRKSRYKQKVKSGDSIIVAGGKTGKDGVHGVTFASIELKEEQERSVVQIGDPIEEEKIKRAILKIRELGLGKAITDLGGGGLSSAIGELCDKNNCGAVVNLEKVPLKHANMLPWEIWISESQERMLLCTSKENAAKVLKIFEEEDVIASIIGEFIPEKKLKLFYESKLIGEISISFLFNGLPKKRRKAVFRRKKINEPEFEAGDLNIALLSLLSHPNIASKEYAVRSYDFEVKAKTIVKPFIGKNDLCLSDAAVLKPVDSSYKGIAISCGINVEYGKIDPYFMAIACVDEAIRNNAAAGGRRIAILDNFSWGNPDKEEQLGMLVRACEGIYHACKALKVPIISGKDSLYNESKLGAITPTLLISALGMVSDIRKSMTTDFKEEGSSIFIIGKTRKELGGSHYYKIKGFLGKSVPELYPEQANVNFSLVQEAIEKELLLACHDVSEGGIAVGVAEMCIAGNIGASVDISKVIAENSDAMRDDFILFSESLSRFIVEVDKENEKEFLALAEKCGASVSKIGETAQNKKIIFKNKEKSLISLEVESCREAFENGIKEYFEGVEKVI